MARNLNRDHGLGGGSARRDSLLTEYTKALELETNSDPPRSFAVSEVVDDDGPPRSIRWRVVSLAVLGYVIFLRLIFLGTLNLLPEEAYYWNYAQHLDIGYLDHPPMVAWMIWLTTKLGGNTEFAVRIGASASWLVAAFFCFRLTRNLFGETPAFVALMIFCVLPFFFAIGLLMTPDAPLTAAWSGALFFLERAIIGGRRAAWLGVGLCMGFGMLSKYTIALLGPATLLFLLLDPGLRRSLWQPWPYVAAAIAMAVFSPVIIWNVLHDWASFSFQGLHRLEQPMRFALPVLVASLVVLLTPVGLIAVSRVLFERSGPDGNWLADRRNWLAHRGNAFVAIYTLVPLSVFTSFSLFHEVKLNWTGPIWLAILPALAARLVTSNQTSAGVVSRRSWMVTVAVALLIYAGALHYLVCGLAGVGPNKSMSLGTVPIGWKEFGAEVGKIAAALENSTGKEPLRVGMDRYSLSSEVAFYDPDQNAFQNTAGRSLFGADSLMYELWFPAILAEGRDIILVSRWSGGAIANKSLSKRFRTLAPIQEQIVHRGSLSIARFFWRIGYGYKPSQQ